jgi:hypothetical protein
MAGVAMMADDGDDPNLPSPYSSRGRVSTNISLFVASTMGCVYLTLRVVLCVAVATIPGFVQSFTPPQWKQPHSTSRPTSATQLAGVFPQAPQTVFSKLVGSSSTGSSDQVVGLEEIQQGWDELQDLLSDGELLPSELEDFFRATSKAPGTTDKLDEAGFAALYESIDNLFEDVEETNGEEIDITGDDDQAEDDNSIDAEDDAPSDFQSSREEELLSFLSAINSDTSRLPCGLLCTDSERELIQALVSELELEPTNLVLLKNGKIDVAQVLGEWDMLYTSSRVMRINKSLSGLGRSTSEMAQFVRLRHRLSGSKFLGTCEYIESFGTDPATALDVTITGEWMLKDDYNPFTGAPATVLCLELEKLMYGNSINKAGDWPSLGPIKRLDIIYMKGDLLIARANVSLETIFVYQRINS